MRKLLMFVGFLVLLVAVAGAGLLFALQDANRFKPQLAEAVKQATGLEVAFNGDLRWQLWPPVVLAGEDIAFTDDETAYAIGEVGVKADALALLRGGELVVQDLRAASVVMTDTRLGDVTRLQSVRLQEFQPGQPSRLQVSGTLETPEGESTSVTLDGLLTYFPAEDRLTLANADFDYGGIAGRCDAQVSQLSRVPAIAYRAEKEDLLPLDSFRAYDWLADCKIPEISADQTGGLALRDVSVTSENTASRSNTKVKVPQFFGGTMTADVAIDTRRATPRWTIKSDADALQAQEVANLIAPKLAWVAPLLANGEFDLRGNTSNELLASVDGAMRIDAQSGTIDISKIKEMVLGIAQLAGEGERVSAWQDQLAYESLAGDWKVKGNTHDLDFELDNLTLRADGDYDPVTDRLDMTGSLQINEHPTLNALDVNPDLYGLRIPMRCQGTALAPSCGLDAGAAQQALAELAANKARGRLNDKLDDVIGDKVPEEYRDTAREALKSIGGLFKKKD